MDRKRMTATERDAMMYLAIGCDIVESAKKKLSDRTRGISRARSRLGIANWAMESLLNDYMATMPTEQLITFRNNMKMCTYVIGVKSPTGSRRDEKNYGMWISFDTLNKILAGCHDHCLMCDKNKAERNACELKKALDEIPNDTEEKEGDCSYYGVL